MEKFNPQNPGYKKVEDLPQEERDKFKNTENGFIKKTVIEDPAKAQKISQTKLVRNGYRKILEFEKKGLDGEAKILTEDLESEIRKLEE